MRLIWIAALAASFHCTAFGAGKTEFYSERPAITSIQANQLSKTGESVLGQHGQQLLRGHLEAVSLLLELYPDRELVFLARDAELLYDAAVLMTQNDPVARGRLRLLNVSKTSLVSEALPQYLEQEGVSKKMLEAGRQFVFIDTGFEGSIARRITSLFPANYRKNFKIHLMCSSRAEIPSTRGFLTSLTETSLRRNPQLMKNMIEAHYEYLPHYTYQATDIRKNPKTGKWDAVSKQDLINQSDVISRKDSKTAMAELATYLNEPAQQELVRKRRSQVAQLRKTALTGDSQKLKTELQAILKDAPGDPFVESLVRDFLEASKKNLGLKERVSLTSLSLKEVPEGGGSINNYELLQKAYPKWKKLLKNPEEGLHQLMTQGRYAEVETLSKAVVDDAFPEMLAIEIGKAKETSELKALVLRLVNQNEPRMNEQIAMVASPRFKTAEMREVVEKLIEKGDAVTLRNLVLYYFPKPKNRNKVELMKQALVRAKDLEYGEIVQHAFSDHLAQFPEKTMSELTSFLPQPCLKPQLKKLR